MKSCPHRIFFASKIQTALIIGDIISTKIIPKLLYSKTQNRGQNKGNKATPIITKIAR